MPKSRSDGQYLRRQPRRSSLLSRCFCGCGLSFLLQLAFQVTQEGFCEPAVWALSRSTRTSRAAEASEKTPKTNPVRELEQKLTAVLGKKPGKKDIVYRYQATMELPCLEKFSTTSVRQLTVDGGNPDECKRKVAAAMLAALDFEALEAESQPNSNATSKAAAKKKATKKKKESKLKDPGPAGGGGSSKFTVGEEVEATVTGSNPKGLDVRVTGVKAFLPAAELGDSFPDDMPENGTTFTVRVLETDNDRVKVTRREGSLERPSIDGLKMKASLLKDWDNVSSKVDAEVIGYDFTKAYLRVASPSNSSKVTIADLMRDDFAEGAEKDIRIGNTIQVRRKYSKSRRGRVYVTMREEDPSELPTDIKQGDTLQGTVESILKGAKPAVFVDVGVGSPAYLDWQECGDGHDRSNFNRLRVGTQVSVRVLKVDGDRLYVTMRSGDLYRATLEGNSRLPRTTPEVMTKFMKMPVEQELEGEVFRLYPTHAVVAVKSPDGDVADGYLASRYFSEEFRKEASPGMGITVSRLPEQNVTGLHLMVTMQDAAVPAQNEELADGTEEDAEPASEESKESEPLASAQEEPPTAASDTGPLEGLKDFLMR